MAITRAQQAKQMLQDGGMLVKPSTDGKRPGYSNPNEDRAREEAADRREQASVARTQGKSTPTAQEVRDIVSAGPERDTGLERERQRNITKLKEFKEYKPPVKTPPLGPFKFFKSPLQKFSNFTTARNRKFFEDVIRAGKIPGLNFATLDDLTPQELEDKYQDYMSERLAGNIDAYGNPLMRGDDGPDPIPFIPKPIEDDTEEDTTTPVRNLGGATARIGGSLYDFDTYNECRRFRQRSILIRWYSKRIKESCKRC
jgi:hypothetical protein